MTLESDSAVQHNAGGGSGQDPGQVLYGPNAYAQHSGDESVDGMEMDKASVAHFRPFAPAPEPSRSGSLIIPDLNAESDISGPGGYAQWNEIPTPMQNVVLHDPDAKSSFGIEYDFKVQEFGQNPNQAFRADLIHGWEVPDFEYDTATGGVSNLNDPVGISCEDQPLNSGLENFSASFLQASSADSSNEFQTRIDTRIPLPTELWPSTRNVSLPLEPSPRRSRRRSKVPAVYVHVRPKDHLCDRCSSAFSRAGDLRRHYKVHFPHHRTFHCLIEGCNRSGERGFYRRDKLHDHQRQAHGFHDRNGLALLQRIRGGSSV
jgi:hypothetical protein